jgi:hypothetical protein
MMHRVVRNAEYREGLTMPAGTEKRRKARCPDCGRWAEYHPLRGGDVGFIRVCPRCLPRITRRGPEGDTAPAPPGGQRPGERLKEQLAMAEGLSDRVVIFAPPGQQPDAERERTLLAAGYRLTDVCRCGWADGSFGCNYVYERPRPGPGGGIDRSAAGGGEAWRVPARRSIPT